MTRRRPFLGAVIGALLGAGTASAQPSLTHVEANLEPVVQVRGRPIQPRTLAEEMAAHHVPAVSLAVLDHGRVVWAKAYGLADVTSGAKADVHTLFLAGSISKPVAATGAMRLVQDHLIDLDAPVNDQLKSWRLPDNAFTQAHPVTPRELWTHTAGTTVHGFPGYPAGKALPSLVQILDGAPPANTAPVVVEREPGTRWNYSGGGITVAQLLMTDVTKEPFPALMHRLVLAPAGMTDSTYEQPLPSARASQAATGYLRSGAPVEGRFHIYPEMAAAGLWTTPTDLAKWALALEKAYDGGSTRLMSQASARTMLTPGLGGWGVGVAVAGSGDELRFSHAGDDWGFKANLVAWPKDRRAIVAMANGDDGMIVVMELMQAVAREYGWKGLEPAIMSPVSLAPQQIREITGSYGHGLAVITSEADGLSITAQGSKNRLIPTGGDRFMADAGTTSVVVTLNRDGAGAITSLSALGMTLPRDR